MPKTQFYTATSIDGFIADEYNSLDWLFEADSGGNERFGPFFEGVDGRILSEDVVADLGVGHGAAHLRGRAGDGVGTQIDHGHREDSANGAAGPGRQAVEIATIVGPLSCTVTLPFSASCRCSIR